MKPVMLYTRYLIMRRAIEGDSEDLFRHYLSDSDSSRFLTRKPHAHIDQTIKFLNDWCHLPWDRELDKFAWVIALADTNEAVGIFLVELEQNSSAQIHYGIGSPFAGQGFITEAGHAVVQWLNQEGVRKVWAMCDLANEASIKVLKKLGFKNEGILKNRLTLPAFGDSARDCYLYVYTV